MAAFLFQENVAAKAGQVLVFAVLGLMDGKRIRVLVSLVLMSTVVFANLLVPDGRVLWNLGIMAVTDEALRGGVFRGLTVLGLLFLSRLCISPRLELTGRFGNLLSRTFYFYSLLLQAKDFQARRPIASLDRILLRAWQTASEPAERPASAGVPLSGRTSAAGWGALAGLVSVNLALALLSVLEIV